MIRTKLDPVDIVNTLGKALPTLEILMTFSILLSRVSVSERGYLNCISSCLELLLEKEKEYPCCLASCRLD